MSMTQLQKDRILSTLNSIRFQGFSNYSGINVLILVSKLIYNRISPYALAIETGRYNKTNRNDRKRF